MLRRRLSPTYQRLWDRAWLTHAGEPTILLGSPCQAAILSSARTALAREVDTVPNPLQIPVTVNDVGEDNLRRLRPVISSLTKFSQEYLRWRPIWLQKLSKSSPPLSHRVLLLRWD